MVVCEEYVVEAICELMGVYVGGLDGMYGDQYGVEMYYLDVLISHGSLCSSKVSARVVDA